MCSFIWSVSYTWDRRCASLFWATSNKPRTTDTQWRHKSKKSENLGRCGRQNMLRPYLKIWEWELIFGRAVKAISWPGVRSPCVYVLLFLLRKPPWHSYLFKFICNFFHKCEILLLFKFTDYGRPVRKSPSLHGRKSTPTPKFLGTAEAYFVCQIGPNFQMSLI